MTDKNHETRAQIFDLLLKAGYEEADALERSKAAVHEQKADELLDGMAEEVAAFLPGAKIDARAALVKKVGMEEANKIARTKYGLQSIHDMKTPVQGPGMSSEKPSTNPWRKGPGWNLTRQGQITKANPQLAANLKAAAERALAS
jgi:hypothetical protein